jgi:hypothetical protein
MNPIVKYFTGERQESFLFLGLGLLGLALAVICLSVEIIGQIDPLKSLQIDPPFEGTKLECLKSG